MRQKRLLFILLALLALSALYALWATPRTGTRTEATEADYSAQPSRSERRGPDADRQSLHVELLQPAEREYPGFKRDIFAPLFPPPKKVRKPVPEKVVEPVEPFEPEPLEPYEPPEVVRKEVREALARFTFLGFLDKGDERTVFLSSGDDIFLVKEGDRFGEKGRFAVLNITTEELSIRQGDDPRLITIPLVEQAPLVPSL